MVGEIPDGDATPEDYEAMLGPLYAWLHVVARYTTSSASSASAARRTRGALLTDSGPRPLRDRALAARASRSPSGS